jgi:hypothetical protein
VWLRAPPYRVVDLTIGVQDYVHGEERHLPGYVCDEHPASSPATITDLLDDHDREALHANLRRTPRLEDISGFARDASIVRHHDVAIRYVPTGVTAADVALEEARNLCLTGKYPLALWVDFVTQMAPPSGPP